MITNDFATDFAQEWINAWNSHDLDRILSHYTDDFVIETPLAARLVPESGGVLAGKDAIRAYWQKGLSLIPDLHFELLDVLSGIRGLTIYYTNRATGRRAAENIFFNPEGKVDRVVVTYSLS